jgi:hypothetical protein
MGGFAVTRRCRVKKFTLIVSLLFLTLAVAFGPAWIDEHPTAAAVLGASGVLVIIGLAVLFGVLLGGTWTRRTMQAGAEIALKAQQVNDEWDARKTAAFAALMRQGVTIGRQTPEQPALPLPGQLPGQLGPAGETIFLPPLAEFGQVGRSYQVIDGESEVTREDAS